MGDFNLDFHHWANTGYHLKNLVEMVKHLRTGVSLAQVVDKPTRFATMGSTVVRSLVDHCYVSDLQTYSTPQVATVGDSDYLGQIVSKLTQSAPTRP